MSVTNKGKEKKHIDSVSSGYHKGKKFGVPRGTRSENKPSPINWNGTVDDGRVLQNYINTPGDDGNFIWSQIIYTWNDVFLVAELAQGLTSRRRSLREQRQWLEEWTNREPEKTKQLVHLICRVKGEKVYDESKEVDLSDVNITLEDVDLVTRRVLGKKVVSLVVEVGDEVIKNTKLVENYETTI